MHILLHSMAPTLEQGTTDPHLCQRLLDTHGKVWISLLWGSLLLSPGSWYTQGSVWALRAFVFQSCVSSGGSMVGLMATSSKRVYAIPRSAAPRAPAPAGRPLLTHTFTGDSQIHFCLSLCGVSGCWCTQGLFEPSEHLWWVRGLTLKVISCFKSVNFLISSMISGKFREVIGHV